MSEILHFFENVQRSTVVALRFNLAERIQHWSELRRAMRHGVPEPFTRDEWSYLAMFLTVSNLRAPFVQGFGEFATAGAGYPSVLVRPRGTIGIWLPNNVSVLGPLTLILASLTGAPLRLKVGSHSQDLTQGFLNYAREHLHEGELAAYLREQVEAFRVDREHPVNAQMAAEAKVRLVFGSDSAVAAIESLPHPPDSASVAFRDHRSEAWIEPAAFTDEQAIALIRVFAIYGRAGCTSPARVIVLNGSETDVSLLQRRLVDGWPRAVPGDVAMHVASRNILEHQLALAQGWQAQLTQRNAAVVIAGRYESGETNGLMSLPVIPAAPQEAIASLPPNIQTVGHCLLHPEDPAWLQRIAGTPIKRFVPISKMHHFGTTWDGVNFWRQLFEDVGLS